jgi:Holliday junction resolvasome RuvABC endonuclease subunit
MFPPVFFFFYFSKFDKYKMLKRSPYHWNNQCNAIVHSGVCMRGLTVALKKTFYPHYLYRNAKLQPDFAAKSQAPVKGIKSTWVSGMTLGRRVDREISGGIPYDKACDETKNVLDYLKKKQFSIVATQVAVAIPDLRVGTKVDLLVRDAQDKLLVIEVKTGYLQYKYKHSEKNMLPPFQYFTDCVFNQHRMQLYFGGVLWNQTYPEHTYDKAILLYVNGRHLFDEHYLNLACFQKHLSLAQTALAATKNITRQSSQKKAQKKKEQPKPPKPPKPPKQPKPPKPPKQPKAPAPSPWPATPSASFKYRIGVDMSLRSPGVACVSTNIKGPKHVVCAFFPQRVRERKLVICSENFHCRALPAADPKLSQFERMVACAKAVARCVTSLCAHFKVPHPVVIEGYPFAMTSSSSSVLFELGGMLRMLLHEAGVPFVACSPTTAKKAISGSGKADKRAVVSSAIESDLLPRDIYTRFTLRPPPPDRQPPNPVQDLADAVALALCSARTGEPGKKKKKRKRATAVGPKTTQKRRKKRDRKK